MNFLRGNTRRSLLGSLSGAAPAAATFLGIRIGRHVILRVSALLTIRTLISAVQLPLDSGVTSYLWTFFFASVQASIAVAAASSLLDVGGFLSALARRFFWPSSDAAFVKLYGNLVLVVGPLCGLVEAAVLTYELMRISRSATEKMFAAEERGEGKLLRRSILAAALACAGLCAFIIQLVRQVYTDALAAFMGGFVIAQYTACLLSDDGHVLETGLLMAWNCMTFAIGLIEEIDCPTSLLDWLLLGPNGAPPTTHISIFGSTHSLLTEELRALMLIYTLSVLLVAMSRAPRFFRLVQIGAEKLEEEEKSVLSRPMWTGSRTGMDTSDTPGVGDASSMNAAQLQVMPTYQPNGVTKAAYNAMVLMAVTFRVLVWSGEVQVSEYLPGLCRMAQVGLVMALHRVYLRMGGEPQTNVAHVQEPLRDIAGNIIPNSR